jgi:hypothetical protein
MDPELQFEQFIFHVIFIIAFAAIDFKFQPCASSHKVCITNYCSNSQPTQASNKELPHLLILSQCKDSIKLHV